MVLSYATMVFPNEPKKIYDPNPPHRMQALAIDISRAYFNAVTLEDELTSVEFPPQFGAPPDMCGLLERHMYGTHRAADGWQSEYPGTLRGFGPSSSSTSSMVAIATKSPAFTSSICFRALRFVSPRCAAIPRLSLRMRSCLSHISSLPSLHARTCPFSCLPLWTQGRHQHGNTRNPNSPMRTAQRKSNTSQLHSLLLPNPTPTGLHCLE